MHPNKTEEENSVRFLRAAHYYSLLGPITLPLSLVALPFHSLFLHLPPLSPIFHRRTSKTIEDRSIESSDRTNQSLFILISKVSRRYKRVISRFSCFSRFGRTWEKFLARGIDVEREWKNIREREVWITRLFFYFLYILCGWIRIIRMNCAFGYIVMEQAITCSEK